MEYNLELEKVVKNIKKQRAKSVLLQLPDGLKPKALEISKLIEDKTNAEVLIWQDTCFGACDLPLDVKTDLIVQFGHSAWPYKRKDIKIIK